MGSSLVLVCWDTEQDSPKMALVPCIVISTGYILLVLFLCELARKAIAPLNDGLVKIALNEAIAAADLCGVCFELIIVADNYLESLIEGNMSRQVTIVRIIAQVVGGVAVFRLIQVLWAIEIAETHVGRAHSSVYNVCSA